MENQRQPKMPEENPIIVALDVPDWPAARELVDELYPVVSFFKIGMELFTAEGPRTIEAIKAIGGKVFLDLKYHDIPNTLKGAIAAAARLGVDMLTIHISGGTAMLEAAAHAAALAPNPLILLGVTVLTSIDGDTLQNELRIKEGLEDYVVYLGKMAIESGLQGIVASPREVKGLRQALGKEALIVTPGIRPSWGTRGDQRRVASPQEALALGASYLVIGRPITAASDPLGAAERILEELSGHTER